MEIEIKKYLYDIQQSILSIENYLGENLDFNVYMSNQMLRRAVEREFEIIGEAMNRLEKNAPNINISAKKQIIGMRNRVIHGYDKIDDGIIWGVVVRHLPVLKREIEQMIKEIK
ncbi:MAG: DUF86 domain-containing protein [Bacteroidales bacterium]|jgi:uncharacterized protein with HEPN domain|nr:DUF86 domain-containing protein [Bacteroidales bacterium]